MLVVIIHWSLFWNLNLVYVLQYLPIPSWLYLWMNMSRGEHHEVQRDVRGCPLLLVRLWRCMPSAQLFLICSLEMTAWQGAECVYPGRVGECRVRLGRKSPSGPVPSCWPRGPTRKWSPPTISQGVLRKVRWLHLPTACSSDLSPGFSSKRQEPATVRRWSLSATRLHSRPISSDSAGSQQGLSHSLPYGHTQRFPPGLGKLLRAGGVKLLYLGLPRPMTSLL